MRGGFGAGRGGGRGGYGNNSSDDRAGPKLPVSFVSKLGSGGDEGGSGGVYSGGRAGPRIGARGGARGGGAPKASKVGLGRKQQRKQQRQDKKASNVQYFDDKHRAKVEQKRAGGKRAAVQVRSHATCMASAWAHGTGGQRPTSAMHSSANTPHTRVGTNACPRHPTGPRAAPQQARPCGRARAGGTSEDPSEEWCCQGCSCS
jgi:hypothetical protein